VKFCTLLACVAFAGPISAEEVTSQDFDHDIAPLIAQRCLTCHSGNEPKGKLDLSSRTTAMAGGESGTAIKPGSPEESLFWENINSDQMPPRKPLSASEKDRFRIWIADGALWGTESIDPFRYSTDARAGLDWWSLQPLRVPQPPTTTRPGWASNPIDAFVDAKLREAGLAPSKEADKRTLIRRLSFDLLGLPPTPEEINAFLIDTSDHAYESLVDRLLASPHYGERWARHWLDVVRFGESNGFEYDQPRDNAWPYRNWVIDALNQDMPYDEFVRMQLAGDILQPDNFNAITATGFLVAGPHNTTLPANDKMRMSMAQDEIEDLVGIVGQTFLGLTANCARCHDHKFDPISQKEYYQLAATLTGVTHGERSVPVLQAEKDALTSSQLQKLYTCVSNNPGITRVLNRGDVGSPAEEVSPAGLGAVPGGSPDFGLAPNASDADRRLKLAEWVTHPDNPLFARVMVNRLWQYHFGQGMVTTPSDFGFNGGQPSHPDLLDWLAQAFRNGDYRLKPIHRLMVTSATYRQSSAHNAVAAQIDSDNRLLWRKTPQRLEAEEIRDAVLVATGQLNSAIGGVGYRDVRHFEFKGSNFYESVNETGPEALRRTIYRFSPRGGRNPFLDTFDCPDPSVTTPRRATTTTPLQALALMNNALVFTVADGFADRLQREASETTAAQVKLVYLVAYGREADEQDVQLATRFVQAHGLPSFCRVILNSNEFLYVQ